MSSSVTKELIMSLPNSSKRRLLVTIYKEMNALSIPLNDPNSLNKDEWDKVFNNTVQLNAILDIAMKLK